MVTCQLYTSDISDEEWALIHQHLQLFPETACQRRYELREVFNTFRYLVRSGAQWRMQPHDFPPWAAVYQQSRRWFDAGVFETLSDNLRKLLRQLHGREAQPTACILDSRTLQSTPESVMTQANDARERRCIWR